MNKSFPNEYIMSVVKKGIIVVNGYRLLPSIEHMAKRMGEELFSLGVETEVLKTTEIMTFINHDGSLKRRAMDASFILYLDKDRYLSHMLEQSGFRLFNSAKPIEICDDKMLTYINLLDKGIKMPKTVSGPLNYSGEDNGSFIASLLENLSFPLVAKTNFGSMGRGVSLLQNKEELIAYESEFGSRPRLFQEFIPSSKGMDYRLITINGKFLTGMRRRNLEGDFRSNIASGGVGEQANIPAPFIEMAEKVSTLLGLDYAGIDLLMGPSGEPIFCEANSNAFIQGIEKTTGTNVAKAYAEHIVKEIWG